MPRGKPAEDWAMLLTCSAALHAYFKTNLKAKVRLLVINFHVGFGALTGKREVMRSC